MYQYNAKILRVVDGDTVDASVDLGFSTFVDQKFRLYGINTPELNTEQGKHARNVLRASIEGKSVTIETFKDKREKYGRYLAIVTDSDGVNWNEKLIADGLAVPYYGVGKV